jgi:hypothetical protein
MVPVRRLVDIVVDKIFERCGLSPGTPVNTYKKISLGL